MEMKLLIQRKQYQFICWEVQIKSSLIQKNQNPPDNFLPNDVLIKEYELGSPEKILSNCDIFGNTDAGNAMK